MKDEKGKRKRPKKKKGKRCGINIYV